MRAEKREFDEFQRRLRVMEGPKAASTFASDAPQSKDISRHVWEGSSGRVGPGNFTPSLTDPDLTLSRHPARATARRLPPSIEYQVPPVAG
jgi:hypothetical protein